VKRSQRSGAPDTPNSSLILPSRMLWLVVPKAADTPKPMSVV